PILHRGARLFSESQQPIRIVEQDLSGRREMQPLALADEKHSPELLLELANPRRDIGLYAMQPFGGARHATLANDRAEDLQIRQIHSSLLQMKIILIIHFM